METRRYDSLFFVFNRDFLWWSVFFGFDGKLCMEKHIADGTWDIGNYHKSTDELTID